MKRTRFWIDVTLIVACIASLVLVAWHGEWQTMALALMAVVYLTARVAVYLVTPRHKAKHLVSSPVPAESAPLVKRVMPAADDQSALVEHMLNQRRYALLLRDQIVGNLSDCQRRRASEALNESMALVPEGDVLLRNWRAESGEYEEGEPSGERVVRVEAVYVDRYPVTNAEYAEFVAGGGYEQMSLWDPEIWPGVLDFVDQSGQPGPRNWQNGSYPKGLEDHPVVGVSWYEATAFAHWVGKRLPTDPEWVKAGGWPVSVRGAKPLQRKYPWGDTMNRRHANLWGSGKSGTSSVSDFSDGVSVGGVYHLIGNVWEWTHSNFGAWDVAARRLELMGPMKSIRGGAFDTYFDNQATCQFQSGDSSLARKHNIGFRCALGACDVAGLDDGTGEFESSEAELELAETAA